MKDTIIFDLGNVLVRWNPRNLYKKIFSDEQEMEYFLTKICTMDWNEQQDAGRSWAEATKLLIDQYPKYTAEINAYFDRWPEMLGGQINENVEILKALKDGGKYRIYALTNWSAETFPFAVEQFEWLNWFEGVIMSGEVKLKKPDPKIYELTLDTYDIDRSKAVFVDDSLRNVKASRELGLDAIHFTPETDLRKELEEVYGIVI